MRLSLDDGTAAGTKLDGHLEARVKKLEENMIELSSKLTQLVAILQDLAG